MPRKPIGETVMTDPECQARYGAARAGRSIHPRASGCGNKANSVGQVGLSGGGTKLTIIGAVTVADNGTGVLTAPSRATFAAPTSSGANLILGSLSDSSGAVIVSGQAPSSTSPPPSRSATSPPAA